MRLGNWLEKWYNLYVVPAKLAPNTLGMYRRAIAAVPEELADTELSQLSTLDLLAWIRSVELEHPRAAQLDRLTLSRALRIAGKLGLCSRDMVDADIFPQVIHSPAKAAVFNREQFRAYITAAKASPLAPLLLLCCCGLRRGEALGVRWTDVDFTSGVIHIQRQRMRYNGAYSCRALKSAAADRCIMLPDEVLDALRAAPRTTTGYLCNATPEALQSAHRAVIGANNLPHVTLHGLRHTVATLAAETQTITEVQHALGHARYTLTADLYCNHLPAPSGAVTRAWCAV